MGGQENKAPPMEKAAGAAAVDLETAAARTVPCEQGEGQGSWRVKVS